MVYQQFTNAVMTAYAGAPAVGAQLEQAAKARRWLEGLEIDSAVRDPLVEQVAALEEGFRRLATQTPDP
jgi:hypothetical protein